MANRVVRVVLDCGHTLGAVNEGAARSVLGTLRKCPDCWALTRAIRAERVTTDVEVIATEGGAGCACALCDPSGE